MYEEFGNCAGKTRQYPAGWLCVIHGHSQPTPDPDSTAEALARRQDPRRDPEMVTQMVRAQEIRDSQLARVDGAASDEWKDFARRAIWHCATTMTEFTVDDVWARLEEVGATSPTEPRALGPIVMKAMRAGAIEDTGRMDRSTRRNASKITIYRKAQT